MKQVMRMLVPLVCLGANLAYADDLRMSMDVGSTGVGLYIATPAAQNWIMRFGGNYLNYSRSVSSSDVTYDTRLKTQNMDFLLDWYALNGNFRFTAGAIYNGTTMTATGQAPSGSYTINGNTYTTSQFGTINADVSFRRAAPYLGIGWESNPAPSGSWGFTSDFGVVFAGSPRSTLSSSGCTASAALCTQFANDLASETGKVNDAVKNLRYYPVARIGLNYKF